MATTVTAQDIDAALACVVPVAPDHAAEPMVVDAPLEPHQAAPRLLGLPRPVFLDSSLPGGRLGRYSYLSADPFLVLRSRGRRLELTGPLGRAVLEAHPFELLRALLRRYPVARSPGLPPFVGGAVGFFAYDLGRSLERVPEIARDEGVPDLELGLYDWVLAADHEAGRSWLIASGLPSATPSAAEARIAEIEARLAAPPPASLAALPPVRLRPNVSREAYLHAVGRAKRHIARGDIYQVCLSQRLEGDWSGPSWPLYERLRATSPAPFGAYLSLGEITLLSASPELFLRLDGRSVETRPIKGTRPRGDRPEQDAALAAELLDSSKERSENVMIVDLLRNDLNRVCRVGSVEVPELLRLEGYASVWHLVSAVVGELRPEVDAIDLLQACFPGGSVTGCPKIRAMEIIERLEPVRRGAYCGAIGYLGFDGAMETSITIRTLVLREGRVHLAVGGAVMAESDPAAEHAETLAKARSGLAALGAQLEGW